MVKPEEIKGRCTCLVCGVWSMDLCHGGCVHGGILVIITDFSFYYVCVVVHVGESCIYTP